MLEITRVQEKAFVYFDSSCDGMLEKNEITAALSSTSRNDHARPAKGAKHAGVGEMLFKVLDLDDSGTITFKGVQGPVLSHECFTAFQYIPVRSFPS